MWHSSALFRVGIEAVNPRLPATAMQIWSHVVFSVALNQRRQAPIHHKRESTIQGKKKKKKNVVFQIII